MNGRVEASPAEGATGQELGVPPSLAATLKSALNWPGDIPDEIVHRAASDRLFLSQLIGNRHEPDVLKTLIGTPGEAPRPWRTPPASADMLQRASFALVKWAKAGFGTVDAETFERRRDACRACPNLAKPGRQLVHKILPKEQRVCDLCGCAVDHKARLPTEDCPAPHPDDPARTRWGDPRP